jgi:hypothetical protein
VTKKVIRRVRKWRGRKMKREKGTKKDAEGKIEKE